MRLFGRGSTKNDDNFTLKGDPDGMTSYYMDTMMCNNFYLQNEECMQDYMSRWTSPWSVITGKKRKLYRECLDYLDQYKACIVGINQDKMLMAPRKRLTEEELFKKRQDQKEKQK